MYWNEGDSSVAVMPTAEPAKSMQPSWCTGGNPQMGQNATQVTADWANTITAEMADMVTAANVTLDKTKNNQVRIANNMRGWFTWDADTDYTGEKSFVIGTDGIPYRAVQDSGPGTEAGYIDPVQDTGAYWETLASWLNIGSMPPIDPETLETNFYIRTDGNDDNDGLEDNAEHAFRTLQGAVDKYLLRYKTSPYRINFNITMPGEYGPCVFNAALYGLEVYIIGLSQNQDSVTITNNSGPCIYLRGGTCYVQNVKCIYTGSAYQHCIRNIFGSVLRLSNITVQSTIQSAHPNAIVTDSTLYILGGIKIIGSFTHLFLLNANSNMWFGYSGGGATININYSQATASFFVTLSGDKSMCLFNRSLNTISFTGTQSNVSQRYAMDNLSIINTFGGGAGYIPGTNAGTAGTYSTYK